MSLQEYDKGNSPAPQSPNLTNSSNYSSKISAFVDRAHSLNTLHLMAAFCQIFLGMAVVLVSILGMISPVWLSTMLSMFASVASMLGLYFLYTIITNMRDPDKLLGDAIRRVIDAQN